MGLRTTLFALTYDHQLAKVEQAGLRERRRELLAGAAGQVLEIGAGTGANLAHYSREVEALTLTEPEPAMLRRLRQRAREQSPTATVLRAPAEDLPFQDDSFDVVVSTLVLCGVGDQPRALRELHRVLRPGGELRFIEHVRSDQARLARRQDRMNVVNRFMVGCECNRPTLDTIESGGFDVVRVERSTMPNVPSFVSPLISGTATTIPGRRFQVAPSTSNLAEQGHRR
jgi:ubiquinone/menaquinone biosynthesis C-methylase UbiE